MAVFNECLQQGIEDRHVDKKRISNYQSRPTKKRNRVLRSISDMNYREAIDRIKKFEPSSFSMIFSKDAWLKHMEHTFEMEFSSSLLSELKKKHKC